MCGKKEYAKTGVAYFYRSQIIWWPTWNRAILLDNNRKKWKRVMQYQSITSQSFAIFIVFHAFCYLQILVKLMIRIVYVCKTIPNNCVQSYVTFYTQENVLQDLIMLSRCADMWNVDSCHLKTSQELRMLSNVTLNCKVAKIVMNSGSQLSEL